MQLRTLTWLTAALLTAAACSQPQSGSGYTAPAGEPRAPTASNPTGSSSSPATGGGVPTPNRPGGAGGVGSGNQPGLGGTTR